MMGGLAYMTGLPDRPLRAGSSVIDIMGGTFAAVGILAALREREKTGRGMRVTSSLFESTAYLVAQHMAQFELTGEAPPPMSVKRPAWGIYDIFDTAGGGRLFVGVVTDTQWDVFCRAFGAADLAGDPRLKTNGLRVKERAWLVPRINEIMKKHTQAELTAKLESIGLPFAPIAKPWDLLDDPHLKASGGLLDTKYQRQDHPRTGAAARARRKTAGQARRPAASRRARPGIARRARLFTAGDRKPARPAYSRAALVHPHQRRRRMSLIRIVARLCLAHRSPPLPRRRTGRRLRSGVTLAQAKKIAAGALAECAEEQVERRDCGRRHARPSWSTSSAWTTRRRRACTSRSARRRAAATLPPPDAAFVDAIAKGSAGTARACAPSTPRQAACRSWSDGKVIGGSA